MTTEAEANIKDRDLTKVRTKLREVLEERRTLLEYASTDRSNHAVPLLRRILRDQQRDE
jgi:hypothetical protein